MDKDGLIRYTHFGEGSYRATEEKIRDLLEEAGADLSGKPLGAPLVAAAGASLASRGSPFGMTPELYADTIETAETARLVVAISPTRNTTMGRKGR